ncbi:MAG: hypothetical protein H6719_19765 [Sandaracinaceae bacterium]|nr:hypothetical protein [Sandaracinaceae bacterium]
MTGTITFAALGLLVGGSHGLLLARGEGHPLGFLARYALVAGFLVLAATQGHVLAGAAGWGAAFLVGVLRHARRPT